MRERIKEQLLKHHMIEPGDRIVTGLSGGGDSVCLLSILCSLAEELSFSLAALHVHHGIRGEEADGDAAFCERLCADWGVPFETAYVDVPALAKARGQSLEEAAREARYERLEEYRLRLGARRIAVAHHREDNAETVLWNLFRGAGLRGLSGMKPVNGAVIRPLLETSKEEIRRYLETQGLRWRQDSTNEEEDYTRNRIRRHILGYASREINARAAEHICQAAALSAEADSYLQAQAKRWLAREAESSGASGTEPPVVLLDIPALSKEERVMQRYIVRAALSSCGIQRDLSLRHVEAVLSLLENTSGASASRRVETGGGIQVRRSYERLIFERVVAREMKNGQEEELPEYAVDLEKLKKGTVRLQAGGERFELQVFSRDKMQKIPANQYTKWMDYDKIIKSLVFRSRRPGDYFLLPGGKKKTVKAYMIDEKIPSEERDHILVAATDSHVLWIVGRRLCEGVKITEKTRRILQIIRYGGKEDGEDSRIDSGGRGR